MTITMLHSAATLTDCFKAGHTYELSDATGEEFVRSGLGRPAIEPEATDIIVTAKPGARPRRAVEKPLTPAGATPPGLTPHVAQAAPAGVALHPAVPAVPAAPVKAAVVVAK